MTGIIQTDPIIFSKCVHKLINYAQKIMSRQFDLPITPTDVAESLPHRVSDSSEVAFQNNGVLLGRRNLIRAKVLKQSLAVTLRAVGRWLQLVDLLLFHQLPSFQSFSSTVLYLGCVRVVVKFVLVCFYLFFFVLCTQCRHFGFRCCRIGG